MKPEQIRERMELFGLGVGEKESDLFLKSVCDAYEDLYYELVEKEDKVSTLNDAVKYYKNMENNMAQMLSTISEISEKTERAAEKTAQLTVKEAESRADEILAQASEQAAQIIEDARRKAQEIADQAEKDIADSKEEWEAVKAESEAYALRFYELIEAQKAFFEEHRIDVEKLQEKEAVQESDSSVSEAQTRAATQAVPPIVIQAIPAAPAAITYSQPMVSAAVEYPQQVKSAAYSAPASASRTSEEEMQHQMADVSVNRIRKIPNTTSHKEPTMEELQARIPEEIRNIPISDHTETLDEIIQSIKKSYEEVENS